jgi:hypothetical protein
LRVTKSMTGRFAADTATAVRAARDASSVLLVCQLVAGGVAFAVNIFAARALAPAGRGELALLLQIAYLSSLGLLLGCDRSLVAIYAGHSVRAVSRACLRLLRLPSLLGFAVVVVLFTVPGVGDWRTGLALAVLFAVVRAPARLCLIGGDLGDWGDTRREIHKPARPCNDHEGSTS